MADINIYGVLNNATPEGIIAKADQIHDNNLNKKQAEINEEFNSRIETVENQNKYFISEAPEDGKRYNRYNKTWTRSVGIISENNAEVFNDYSNNTAIGNYSHIEGQSSEKAYSSTTIPSDVQQIMMDWYMSFTGWSMAYGIGSHVEGQNCLATGDYSHAEGIKTISANDGSHSEGTGTNAAGVYSHAEGQSTTAFSMASHSEGGLTTCKGNYGHAEGFRCNVENTAGHAEGYITYCHSNYGHSEGKQTSSVGFCAHSEGYGERTERSIQITNISNIEGKTSYFTANNINGLKKGICFIIDNIPYSVLYIESNKVYVNKWIEFNQQEYDIIIMNGCSYGDHSHIENELNNAIGRASSVSGLNCIAFNDNEFACGKYNFSDYTGDNSNKTFYSIGFGDNESNRKNIIEVKENGDIYIYGIGGYLGNNSQNSKTLQEMINNQ